MRLPVKIERRWLLGQHSRCYSILLFFSQPSSTTIAVASALPRNMDTFPLTLNKMLFVVTRLALGDVTAQQASTLAH